MQIKCPASECNETDVRLVDGNTPDDGRVEICYGGLWGSVCDYRWDVRDATVVCRQLGYNGSKANDYLSCVSFHLLPASAALGRHRVVSTSSLFYHLDDVNCNGTEMNLAECMHIGVGQHYCFERQKAGVICSSK